jgi:hypothetical protein
VFERVVVTAAPQTRSGTVIRQVLTPVDVSTP